MVVGLNQYLPAAAKPGTSPWLGSQQQVDDSVANQVTALAGKDSELNRMAATEGLKAANRRGLLNSSMAVDASRDAVLRNVLPIASQDASQAFQKNQAARGFEYGMTAQEQQQRFQSGERLGGQAFQTSERLGTQQFQRGEAVAARGWQTAENLKQRGFLSTQAQLDRTLQQSLQSQQINSQQMMQTRQIAATQGLEAANRALQRDLSANDIAFRMSEGNLTREAAERAQQADIQFQTTNAQLTRDLQEQIASWNLNASDRNAAASMVLGAEATYQTMYNSIMSNPNMDAAARNTQLGAAKNLRDNGLSMVEQMYVIDLKW